MSVNKSEEVGVTSGRSHTHKKGLLYPLISAGRSVKRLVRTAPKKKLFTLVIAMLGIPVAFKLASSQVSFWSNAAEADPDIFFSLQSAQLPTSLQLMINTKANTVGFAKVVINFNPALVRLTRDPVLTNVLDTVVSRTPYATANTTGRLVLVVAASPGTTGAYSIKNLATLDFAAAPQAPNQQSEIAVVTSESQLVSLSTAVLGINHTPTIFTQPTPTPIPTPTVTPRPSSTPIPTPIVTPRPSSTPTSTPEPSINRDIVIGNPISAKNIKTTLRANFYAYSRNLAAGDLSMAVSNLPGSFSAATCTNYTKGAKTSVECVSFGNAPAGTYPVNVVVTDRNGGRKEQIVNLVIYSPIVSTVTNLFIR